MLPFYLIVTFPSGFPVKVLHINLFTLPTRFICPSDLIFFDLIPLIMNHEKHKLQISWKCSFLPLLFLSSKCFLQKQFLRHLQSTSPFKTRSKITHPFRKKNGTIIFYTEIFLFCIRVRTAVFDLPAQPSIIRFLLVPMGWSNELHQCALIIHQSPINLFAFIFLHSVSVLLWPCDIYYLSFLLHAVSISSALTIFQFSAVQCHTVSTCYCPIIMTTNMSSFRQCTSPDLPRPGTHAYFV